VTQSFAIRTRTNVDSAGSGDVNAKPLIEQSFQSRGLNLEEVSTRSKYQFVLEHCGERIREEFHKRMNFNTFAPGRAYHCFSDACNAFSFSKPIPGIYTDLVFD
jgi:hypothetical protein